MEWVRGDRCAIPFREAAFDIVYSNSTIEHLGTWERQVQFAQEVPRVGRAYYVQTPNRWFPIEPHLIVPFIHWLPRTRQRSFYRLTGFALYFRAGPDDLDRMFAELRLLDKREFCTLFPDAHLVTERVAFLPKSLMALGRAQSLVAE